MNKESRVDTATQLALSMSVPTLAVLIGILINNSRLSDLRLHFDSRLGDLEKVFTERLLRVEQVLDARLTRIEQELDSRRQR